MHRSPGGTQQQLRHGLQATHQNFQLESAHACLPYVSSSHPVVHALQADAEVLPTGEYGVAAGQYVGAVDPWAAV